MNKPVERATAPFDRPPPASFLKRFAANSLNAMGWLGLVALIVACVFVLFNIGYAIYKFTDTRYALLGRGVNESVAQLLAWTVMFTACSISFIPIVRIVFWRPKQLDFAAALATPFITFLISLVPANFGPDGKPLQFCTTRPNGEFFCLDHKGVDPLTGVPLEAMTSQIAIEQQLRKAKLLPELIRTAPEQTSFFDSLNGKPQVWYAKREDGCFDLFNRPGVHPQKGEQLLAVNRDIVRLVFACDARNREALKAAERDRSNTEAPTPFASARGGQSQQAPVSPYFDTSAISGGANWTIVASKGDPSAARTIIPTLPQPVSVSLFKPAFFSEGLFENAIVGDSAALKRMNLPDTVARIVLIDAGQPTLTRQDALEGLVRVDQLIHVTSIEPKSGRIVGNRELRAEGAGFSREKALQNLSEDLSTKARSTLTSD